MLLIAPFGNAKSKHIEVLDYDSDTQITVYCISGYVFVELGSKKAGGALTQVMKHSREVNILDQIILPMRCAEYGDNRKK